MSTKGTWIKPPPHPDRAAKDRGSHGYAAVRSGSHGFDLVEVNE